MPEIDIYLSRGVAPGMRFWHGPGRFKAALWAGRACFFGAGCVRGIGVGLSRDLRQLQ